MREPREVEVGRGVGRRCVCAGGSAGKCGGPGRGGGVGDVRGVRLVDRAGRGGGGGRAGETGEGEGEGGNSGQEEGIEQQHNDDDATGWRTRQDIRSESQSQSASVARRRSPSSQWTTPPSALPRPLTR